jgi:hypothetical protein
MQTHFPFYKSSEHQPQVLRIRTGIGLVLPFLACTVVPASLLPAHQEGDRKRLTAQLTSRPVRSAHLIKRSGSCLIGKSNSSVWLI